MLVHRYGTTRELAKRLKTFFGRRAGEPGGESAAGEAEDAPRGGLPDFLIIGAQKSGTTYLYGLLNSHPQVEPPARKEVHYFDSPRNFRKGLDWYRSFFPSSEAARGGFITGEASPYYLYHPHAPRRAAEVVPEARLIAVLRNPVDRAYSEYNDRVRSGFETLSFEEAVEVEAERLEGEKERMLADEYYFSPRHRRYSYLDRGIYVDQLLHWEKFFARDLMLVFESEELFRDPLGSMERAAEFLGLRKGAVESPPDRFRNDGRYSPMAPETRQRLYEYFEPHNRRLYEYLGRYLGWR